ncbi:hypothetical protein D5086_027210 [Populus alba]|uniref:Uncharacterized protein n=1 Tax=Populus alba TaxID=43335 RepID=A0ACC4B4R7_POPAL
MGLTQGTQTRVQILPPPFERLTLPLRKLLEVVSVPLCTLVLPHPNGGPKKRPYTTPIGPDSGSPSEETVAVEKQHPYNNPSCGSSLLQLSKDGDLPAVEPPKRQYLTRSRAVAIAKIPVVVSRPLSSSKDAAPSSTF